MLTAQFDGKISKLYVDATLVDIKSVLNRDELDAANLNVWRV